MRQIAKWTFLCVICTAFGFAATYGVAHSDRVIQTVAAMLPAPAQAAPEVAPPELAASQKNHLAAAAVELDSQVVAADSSALASFTSAKTTVGTLAAIPGLPGADLLQTEPTTGPLTAVGVVTVVRDRQVVLGASGPVSQVNIEVGDAVKAGDTLVALDTTQLDWAAEQAELGLEAARIDFEEAGKAIDDADVAVGQANLLAAQENLALVEAGPTAEQLAAAEASAAAAWASLQQLQEGPTASQIVIAQADLKRAEIAVQGAQREYDKIAWLPEAAATTAADDLQSATIDYEAAKAAYSETVKAPTVADIQSATATAQSAQDTLNELKLKPTPAELATSKATVAQAQADLDELLKGPQQAGVRKAELGVRQAMIVLDNAKMQQEAATVVAPIDGTVLAVNVELGQQASEGDIAAILANTGDVKLTVNVEQRDIARVVVGQQVQIAIYALPNDAYTGVVEQIAPVAEAGTGFVTFPVIIRFTDGPMEKVLPGMTASATFNPLEGEAPAASATGAASQTVTSTVSATVTSTVTVEATAAPTEEATGEATVAPTAVATEKATVKATEEATVEATAKATVEATKEATPEPTEEATSEPTEEPASEATATPGN